MKIAQILSYLSFLRKWYSGFVIILSNIVPSLLVFELDGTPALCYAECMMVCWDGQLPHQLLRKCHFSLQRLWTKINQEQFQADVGLSGNLRYLKMILLKRSSDFGQDSWKSFFPKNMTLFIASYLKARLYPSSSSENNSIYCIIKFDHWLRFVGRNGNFLSPCTV